MLTLAQAKEALAAIGVEMPDFIIESILEDMESVGACLESHYSAAKQLLILTYLLQVLGASQNDKYISSQTAPSGASRSFRYKNTGDAYRGLVSLLRKTDPHGCTWGMIPADPTKSGSAFLYVTKGSCCR